MTYYLLVVNQEVIPLHLRNINAYIFGKLGILQTNSNARLVAFFIRMYSNTSIFITHVYYADCCLFTVLPIHTLSRFKVLVSALALN